MSNYANNQAIQLPAPELAAVMDGSQVLIGVLLDTPVKLIFDNQGTVAVAITTDSLGLSETWRTFPAGEALVLDDDLSAFSKGTQFYGTGASGTFSISYTYIKLG